MTKKQTYIIINDELNNSNTNNGSSETVDAENVQIETDDPQNSKGNFAVSYTFNGKIPLRDDLSSSPSSLSEDRVNTNLSPSQSSVSSNNKILCRVCGSKIRIEGIHNERLVKCLECHELTPVKDPPHGSKYGYCSCNSLAIFKGEIKEIKCLRPECGKIINLSISTDDLSSEKSPEVVRRIDCPNCMMIVKIRTRNKVYDNCPRCGKGSHFMEKKTCTCASFIFYSLLLSLAIIIFVILVMKRPSIGLKPLFYVSYFATVIVLGFAIFICHMNKCWKMKPRPRPPGKNFHQAFRRENWERLMFYRRYV